MNVAECSKWVLVGSWTRMATRSDGMTLAVLVSSSPFGWTVIGLETAETEINTILDAHAHSVVGHYETPTEALLEAEKYQDAWLSSVILAPPCPCEEIEP